MCVYFIYERRDLHFEVDSERQIFEKLFLAVSFMLRVFVRNLLRGSRLVLMSDLGYEPGLLRLITQHNTYFMAV